MKNFIVNWGRGLIDFCSWIILILIVLAGIICLFSNVWLGIGILVIGLILFIALSYLLYLFIDIRDLLKEIVERTKEE